MRFDQAYGFDLPTWNFGFNFTYPIGMRAAKANYARSVLLIDQSVAQLKAQELTIRRRSSTPAWTSRTPTSCIRRR